MATTNDARQFDGKLKSAKDICAWIGDEAKAVYGPSFATEDDDDAGLNLVDERDGAPYYTTVNAGEWVVRGADGSLVAFTDGQYQMAFGAK